MQFDHGNLNHLYTFSSILSRYRFALEWRKQPPTDRDDLPTPLYLHLGCREKIEGVRPRVTRNSGTVPEFFKGDKKGTKRGHRRPIHQRSDEGNN